MTAGDALRALEAQRRIAWAWLPGMRAILDRGTQGGRIPFRRSDDSGWVFPSSAETPNRIVYREGEPDLDDPATVGCLLALLREAVAPWAPEGRGALTGWEGPPPVRAWYVYVQTGPWARQRFDGATEGDAIAAALVWLATVGAPAGAP